MFVKINRKYPKIVSVPVVALFGVPRNVSICPTDSALVGSFMDGADVGSVKAKAAEDPKIAKKPKTTPPKAL